jgi:hypothetical protein
MGFKKTHADHSVLVCNDVFVLLYVDDIIILAPCLEKVNIIKDALVKAFEVTDNGLLTRFVDIDLTRT